jgi:hypothetical protein
MVTPLHASVVAVPFVNVRAPGVRYGVALEPRAGGARRAAHLHLSADEFLEACMQVCAQPAHFEPAAFVTLQIARTLPAVHLSRALDLVRGWTGRPRLAPAIALSDPRCGDTLRALASAGGAALVSGLDAATREDELRMSAQAGAMGASLSPALVRKLAAQQRGARAAVQRLCELCNALALPVLAGGADDSWTTQELMALGVTYLAGASVAAPLALDAAQALPARPPLSVRLPAVDHRRR